MQSIKLSQWASENGYSYNGALKLFHRGGIKGAYQLETGTIRVPVSGVDEARPGDRAVLYGRVSTRKQSDSLEHQMDRLESFAVGRGLRIVRRESEIASGLNDQRKKLSAILLDRDGWDVLVVEHRDRLARFGARWIETMLELDGRLVVYIYDQDADGDVESLSADIISVITSLAGRWYGRRAAEVKAHQALAVMADGSSDTNT